MPLISPFQGVKFGLVEQISPWVTTRTPRRLQRTLRSSMERGGLPLGTLDYGNLMAAFELLVEYYCFFVGFFYERMTCQCALFSR